MSHSQTRPHALLLVRFLTSSCLTVLLVLTWLLTSSHAFASMHIPADGGPSMSVNTGFNTRFRDGSWIPVQIALSNSGADFTGKLNINIPDPSNSGGANTTIYQSPVTLATGAQKQITLYAPFYLGVQGGNQTMRVNLLANNGQVVNTQVTTLRTIGSNDLFIGILSDQSTGFGALGGLQLPYQSAQIDTEFLDAKSFPTKAEVLKNFDLLVLDNFTTSTLSQDQLLALKSWIDQGGALILAGGPEWRRTLGPLPLALLPVTTTGTKDLPAGTQLLPLDSATKGDDIAARSISAPITISTATAVATSTTILATDSTPLIVQKSYGQGIVYYLAFDPALQPVASWSQTQRLWKDLLLRTQGDQLLPPGPTVNYPPSGRFSYNPTSGVGSVIQSLLPNTFPSIWFILVLLLGYILVLGPIRALLVRRLKQRDWSWRITLIAIVVFSLLSYGLALQQKGTSIISSTVSVIRLSQPDTIGTTGTVTSTAHTTTYVGVFVPSQGDFHVHIAGDELVQPANTGFYYNRGSSPQMTTITPTQSSTDVDLQSVNIWTLHTVMSTHDTQIQGGIVSHLILQNGTLSGTITNTLPYSLSDVYVLMNQSYVSLGRIAAGTDKQVSFSLATTAVDPNTFIADQIANSNGLSSQYGAYYNGQQPQNDVQRHVAMLSALSGENNYYQCGGPGFCSQPLRVGGYSSARAIIIKSGGGGSPPVPTQDPLLMPSAPATLIGWADTATGLSSDVTINGTPSTGARETVIQAPLAVQFSGAAKLPANLVTGQLVDVQGQSNDVQLQVSDIYSMSGGSMTFECFLPSPQTLHATGITINETANLTQFLQSTGANNSLSKNIVDVNQARVTLYNWHTHAWDSVTMSSYTASIKDAGTYINPEGRVLLRFAHVDSSQGLIILSKPTLQLQGSK